MKKALELIESMRTDQLRIKNGVESLVDRLNPNEEDVLESENGDKLASIANHLEEIKDGVTKMEHQMTETIEWLRKVGNEEDESDETDNEEGEDLGENATVEEKLEHLLKGDLSWVKEKITVFNGKITFENAYGDQEMDFEEFRKELHAAPHELFTDEHFVVKCQNCKVDVTMAETSIRDEISVMCDGCDTPIFICPIETGDVWYYMTPCKHFKKFDGDSHYCMQCMENAQPTLVEKRSRPRRVDKKE